MTYELSEAIQHAGGKVTDRYPFGSDSEQVIFFSVVIGNARGAILHYENPPAHQLGTRALNSYALAFEHIERIRDEVSFLILSFAPDATHAGGDLKETLAHLEQSAGYDWADLRLMKAFALYKRVRALAKRMHVIAILAGGTYYGGSAEVALWADTIVGDSRASICMSEATIGLIPGWGGVARLIVKVGVLNTRCLVETARQTSAHELKTIGIIDSIVDIPYVLPKRGTEEDRQRHTHDTLSLLYAKAFAFAPEQAERKDAVVEVRRVLMREDALEAEVACRSDPYIYRSVWGKPLAEARDVLATNKTPLAPQSIQALRALVETHETLHTDEEHFVRMEMEFDAELYRHPLLAEGIRAILEKRVPCFALL